MEITEVRIIRKNSKDGKLKAFATITFDNQFVVRDLKIIDGKKGLFVAMPSKKIYEACPKCGKKNPIRNNFCGKCGIRLNPKRMDKREEHRDIAHPINSQTREYIQNVVIGEYKKILNASNVQKQKENSKNNSSYVDRGEIQSSQPNNEVSEKLES